MYFDVGELFWKLCQVGQPEDLWQVVDELAINHPICGDGRSPAEMFSRASSVVLYGAGKFSEDVIKSWGSQGLNPDYCVDSDERKWGGQVSNVLVRDPQALFEDTTPPLVVIAAMSTAEIENRLELWDIPYLYAERDGSVSYVSGHFLNQHRLEFDRVYRALADDESRRVMLAVVKARMFQRYSFPMRGNYFSAEVASYPQYFLEDIFCFSGQELLVDCGAFDGDTLISFAVLMQRLKSPGWSAVAFEADRKNFIHTLSNLARYRVECANVVNAAVGADDFVASSLSYFNCQNDAERYDVQVVSLDKALLGTRPTFIKMDIEGHEIDALSGARKTISAFHPKLAICSYHTSAQLLEVPLFILDNFPDYQLYMRHHSAGTLWETVCYAVAKKDALAAKSH